MPNEIQSRLAENIKKIRKEKHFTQFALAEKADISEAMVKSIETCHAWPSENTLQQISDALETDIYHFFMPVASSLAVNDNVQRDLKRVIRQRYCEYVKEMLDALE